MAKIRIITEGEFTISLTKDERIILRTLGLSNKGMPVGFVGCDLDTSVSVIGPGYDHAGPTKE